MKIRNKAIAPCPFSLFDVDRPRLAAAYMDFGKVYAPHMIDNGNNQNYPYEEYIYADFEDCRGEWSNLFISGKCHFFGMWECRSYLS